MASEFLNEEEKKILELDSRRKIYDIVRKYAGCHFREIERRTNLSTGVVQYHLHYLAKHDLIQEERDGNNVIYFPRSFDSNNKTLLTLLRQGTVRRIILFLVNHKNPSHEEIVDAIKVSPSTVSFHLKKLIHSDIVSTAKSGRRTFYSLHVDKEKIMKLLITYQASFLDAMVDRVVEMWS